MNTKAPIREHIETALFGFGGTTKTIPELMHEIVEMSEFLEKALIDFSDLRENREHDKAYYYEGQILLKKIQSYKRRFNNRIDKLSVAFHKEAHQYHKEVAMNKFNN